MSLCRATAGDGPDVVRLRGWGLHGGLFAAVARSLAGRCRVHSLDLPGHGRSPWATGCADLEGIARRVAERLPDSCSLAGWSLGGMVGIGIATRFPARVRRLALVATTPRFVKRRDSPCGVEAATLSGFARGGVAADWRALVGSFLSLQVHGEERELDRLRALKHLALEHREPSTGALAAGLEILRTVDRRPELGAVAARTLVVGGDCNRLTPCGASQALAAGIACARCELVPRAAHAPFLSHAEVSMPLVADFLGAP
jgi:pimeloyl-[acyl-carrier protein] methyl ester esterase